MRQTTRLTCDITLRVGGVIDKDDELVGSILLQVVGDVERETEVASSVEARLLSLQVSAGLSIQ